MKRVRFSFTAKYVLIVGVLLLAASVILGAVMMSQSQKAMQTLIRENMLDVSNTAAAMMDGDVLGALTEKDVGGPVIEEISKTLTVFADNVDIIYIYAVKPTGDGRFVFTVDPDPVDPGKFGEEVVVTAALVNAGNGVADVDNAPYRDRWGFYYSAYSPVFDSNGKVAGIIGIDFNPDKFNKQLAQNTVSLIVICVASLLVGAVVTALMTESMRKRFKVINRELTQLSANVDDLTEEIVSSSPQAIRAAAEGCERTAETKGKAKTKDEIEIFSDKIHYMQSELRRYVEYIHAQAYTDPSTGVGSKSAYLELVKSLNDDISQGSATFAIAVFDLNGLKSINDNCGHEYGDMIIAGAAICIAAVFGADRTFRIGGDEFISVLRGASEAEVVSGFEKIKEYIGKYNSKPEVNEAKLSLSMGAAEYIYGTDQNYKTVFKRADEQMYFDKGEYYRRYGDRRKHE